MRYVSTESTEYLVSNKVSVRYDGGGYHVVTESIVSENKHASANVYDSRLKSA